ncbi:DEAD/DEAH box RNA helicase [Thecamonas trahens ATCC 50062]|uniref:DEAD/DEAH box RNA helicase n=1 Tax=Thecamonas trahens ATCC 50062 TaxID=461836 RepID=A0A0L0DAS0_THETB|nr:DEAD/DEAH box RNA helicase [Thecamonas trahens ATCC 50062]KNC49330.1 DEAD/DEAH box RNA helicase [Thecamonas trahens ATCC 50062]|eukprot:XP_013758038.1 DEAD/DEAH box RNA helicase [Thecamonas trahens ATCC 50062]
MDVVSYLAQLDAEASAEAGAGSASSGGYQVPPVLAGLEMVEHGGPTGGAGLVVVDGLCGGAGKAWATSTVDTPLGVPDMDVVVGNGMSKHYTLLQGAAGAGAPHTSLDYQLALSSLLDAPTSGPSTRIEPLFAVVPDGASVPVVTGYAEASADAAQETAANSGSLLRAPSAAGSFVRGSASQRPFAPGAGTKAVLPVGARSSGAGSLGLAAFVGDDVDADAVLEGSASTKVEDGKSSGGNRVASGWAVEADEGDGFTRVVDEQSAAEWAVLDESNTSEFHSVVPDMAMKYPFELDPFQKRAVMHLERGENVFVAAHTSAGKTVVAEYAISLSQKHMTRAIYTSPIKALSNQKFRDFSETFDDVGLLTGDVQIHPEATCLIMTTEILRSMLYKGADLIRDVEWVIFDEVHYVNDLERGVVWEEVIIMLPDHVGLIMLSATVANTFEFADWIGRTKKRPVYVVSTDKRPVPLAHFAFVRDELFPLVDAGRNFNDAGYSAALRKFHRAEAEDGGGSSSGGSRRGGQPQWRLKAKAAREQWNNMVRFLAAEGLLPCVVFSFSKKVCEQVAGGLANISLVSSTEASAIHRFIEECLLRLEPADRELPQVLRTRELLKRGIGVHHGGMLPIVKEMVEMLFGRGLCKILFATETFAMGVNMPAKCVVFNQLRKHDGTQFRGLLPGEYTQMAGRAGRRGLDTVGTVIINAAKSLPEASELIHMILGKPYALESQFRLTYNMILNLLRVEDLKVEDMIKRSFSEADNASARPELVAKLQSQLAELEALEPIACLLDGTAPAIEEYHLLAAEGRDLGSYLNATVLGSRASRSLLTCGRVVVLDSPYGPTLGVVLRFFVDVAGAAAAGAPRASASLASFLGGIDLGASGSAATSVVHALVLDYAEECNAPEVVIHPWAGLWLPPRSGFVGSVVSIKASKIRGVTHDVLDGMSPRKLLDERDADAVADAAVLLYNHAAQVAATTAGGETPARLDIVTPSTLSSSGSLGDIDVAEKESAYSRVVAALSASKCHTCPHLCSQFERAAHEHKLKKSANALANSLSDDSLMLMPDYQQRVAVLQMLQYVSDDETVLLKGRVACEINACDELIVAELIFDNMLTGLDPAHIVALLSVLLFQGKTDVEPVLPEVLKEAKESLVELTTRLGLLQAELGLDLDPAAYVANSLNFGLMEVVYQWALGKPFVEICALTDVLEGSIVRCIVRLDDACREVRNAARVIGNAELFAKMEDASLRIKRDIAFAPSLYLAP